MTAHGGGKLDSQVAQATDAHDPDSIGRAYAIFYQGRPDCGSRAHQGRSISRIIAIWYFKETICVPYNAVAEGSEIVVLDAVFFLVLAVLIPTLFQGKG